jgi:large subunit ribosomal protein L30
MPANKASTATQATPSSGDAALLVTQVKSGIGTKPKHRATLRALGLRKIGQSNLLPDRPEIRGMLARVPHLVTVEPAETAELDLLRAGRVRRSDGHVADRDSGHVTSEEGTV